MAKIIFTDEERQTAADYISRIVDGLRGFESINTEDTEPLITVLDIENVFREDVAVKEFSRETILAHAPDQYDGYFQVPKTLV